MDNYSHLTVDDVDGITVLQAMTFLSDYCDRAIGCIGCPLKERSSEDPDERFNCVLRYKPYEWRKQYGERS